MEPVLIGKYQPRFPGFASGNRTHERIINVNDPAAEGGNRLVRLLKDGVELESYTYDNAGRMIERVHATKGTTTYGYDARGLLTQASRFGVEISYTYDALGARKTKTVNGTTTRYLTAPVFGLSRVLVELDASMNIKRTYVYGGDQPLKDEPVAGSHGQDLYLLSDGIVGSITDVASPNGAVSNLFQYDAFGDRIVNFASTAYSYAGQEHDAGTGLIYLRARYYDPSLGRFISADPFWGRLDEPASQNRYAYAHNNPLMYMDPSGLVGVVANFCFSGGLGLGATGCTKVGLVGDISFENLSFDKPYFGVEANFEKIFYNEAGGGMLSGPSYSGTITVEFNSATSSEQLLGLSSQTGGTAQVLPAVPVIVEGGVVIAESYKGLYFGAGLGGGVPFASYSYLTNTFDPLRGDVLSETKVCSGK